ncbi:MAG: alpha/beta fold hydrolase [Acidobacteriaceae bacterium]
MHCALSLRCFARALFAAAPLVTLAAPLAAQSSSAVKPLTVEQIFADPALNAEPPAGALWAPDGTRLTYRSEAGDIVAVTGATGQSSILVPHGKISSFTGPDVTEQDRDHRARYHEASYIWGPDSQHLLFDVNGQLWLYSLRMGAGVGIAQTGSGSGDDPKFAPDGSSVSYIREHNLYLRKLPDTQTPLRLTNTREDTMLNGEVDWVYLEELDVRSNYFWSPDSKSIAYLQMNEASVPQYPIVDWIPTHATVEQQRYPQPGDPNPAVRVGVVSVGNGKTVWTKVPLESSQDYIPRFGWLNHKTLWVETLTRDHKHLRIYFADASTGATRLAIDQTDDKFFDESYDITISGPHILLTSWRDGHTQIYSYSYDEARPMASEARLERQLTSGDGEVAAIKGVDAAAGIVYYLSNEGDPRQQQIWSVHLDGTGKQKISDAPGFHDPVFSPNAKYFIDTSSTAITPPHISMCSNPRECRTFWQAPSLDRYGLTEPKQLELRAGDGATLYASLLLPAGHEANKSAPLINNPYGGPHVQTVADRWSGRGLLFDELLAQHGFAVLHVDNRGMGGRGRAFAQAAYHNLGPIQLQDQLAAIDQVLAQYPQLDPQRLGWWGWSWGGSFTLNALTHSDRFRAGVAVAPVTDWRNYDSIYTERYMGLPTQNREAYRDDSAVTTADKLHGRLLLAQGTGDDNVHMENSIQFIQKLIDADLPYDLQLYPRKTHSIAGKTARTHLYTRILAQFETYLMPAAQNAEEKSGGVQ